MTTPCADVPAIGTTARGYEIGKKCGHLFTWLACEVCGIKRWVVIHGGRPRTRTCVPCGTRRRGLAELEECANGVGVGRLPARLRRQVEVDGETGCWLWQGNVRPNGYASGNWPLSRETTLHRAIYTALVGPIPEGHHLDHLCRVRHCLCPEHLEPVTPGENIRRGELVTLKTHCANGHEWVPENIRRTTQGRACRVCYVERYLGLR